MSGSQQALDLIARVLIEVDDRIAIEDPSYQGTREVLRAAGACLLPVPVDGEGLNTARLPDAARAAFVTASHQFPTGAVLPRARRVALLDWARRNDAVVIEDDYDGEFRYEEQPLESLQGGVTAESVRLLVQGGVPAADASGAIALPQKGDPSLQLLARVGVADPTSLAAYRAAGGYRALAKALKMEPRR